MARESGELNSENRFLIYVPRAEILLSGRIQKRWKTCSGTRSENAISVTQVKSKIISEMPRGQDLAEVGVEPTKQQAISNPKRRSYRDASSDRTKRSSPPLLFRTIKFFKISNTLFYLTFFVEVGVVYRLTVISSVIFRPFYVYK